MELKWSRTGWVAFMCALWGVVALTMQWITYPLSFSIPGMTILPYPISGFDGISEGAYQPMLVLIGTVLAIAMANIEFIGKGHTVTRVITIFAGLLMIVGAALVLIDIGAFAANFTIPYVDHLTGPASAGYGLYITLIWGAAVMIAPVLRMLNILPD